MSRESNNKNEQITFFGMDGNTTAGESDILGFVNNEHYDSAERTSDDTPIASKDAVPSPNITDEADVEPITDAEIAPEHTVRPQKVQVSKEPKPDVVPKKPKSPFWEFDYRKSLILRFIIFISDYIGKAFRNSFFANIFTSFSATGTKFSESYLFTAFSTQKSKKIRTGTKKVVRRAATEATLPTLITRFFNALTKIRTRVYGFGILAFGATALIVHFFIIRFFEQFQSNVYTPITATALIAISVFLIICNNTLSDAIKESVILSTLFFNFLGIKRPQFTETDEIYFSPSGACIIGVLLGALTLFFPAHYVIATIFVLIYTFIAVKYPETGVVSFLMIIPFMSIPALVYVSLVITLAYAFKIATGKRTPVFEFPDIFIALFLLLTLFSEIFTFGATQSTFTSTSFILIYFLCICTLCEKTWFERAINALLLGTCIYATYSIFATFFAEGLGIAIDYTNNTDVGNASATVFGSTSVLTMVLLCGIFFMLAAFFTSKSKSNRFSYILLIAVSLIFMFREASVLVLTALLIGLVIFMMLKSSKTVILVVAAAVVLPLLPLFNSGIYSGVDLLLRNEQYRLEIWSAVINMLNRYGLCGIGSAPDAFSTLYATYYVGNTATVPHAHSLLFQIFISLGVLGIFLFATVLFFILQGSFSYGRNAASKTSKNRLYCYAGMCSVITMVISGIGENIWYNPRIMLLFWLVCGLTVCARRSANDLSDSDKLMLEINQSYNG